MSRTPRVPLTLAVALLATVAAYWVGLSGPFLFDDYGNIEAVNSWREGKQGFSLTLLPNDSSIIFSRPAAMASFMFTAWLGGISPFSYKLGNLAIHLACGVVAFLVLRRFLSADKLLAHSATGTAGLVAAVWLLHPLHASTVLYVVQRMAQLSTLFTLLSILAYLLGRQKLIAGNTRHASIILFFIFPAALIAGVLSKQNAVVAPFLCLVLELAYFSREKVGRHHLILFFGVFAAAPSVAALALLILSPERLLAGYGDWDFTLVQRLLTQPRALLDYIGLTLAPRGPRMGLYTDDFVISKGLLSPASTLLAIMSLAIVTAVAFLIRKRSASIFAGWFFFLIAHGVESSFLPLEMYYEHRNYLPSIGLLLAFAGLISLAWQRVEALGLRANLIGRCALIGILVVLFISTLGRSMVWRSEETIVKQAALQHPTSMRAMLDNGVLHIKRGEYDDAITATAGMRNSGDQRQRVIGHLQKLAVECMRGTFVDQASMQSAVREALPKVTVFEVQMAKLLELSTRTGRCGDHSTQFISDGLVRILQAAPDQTSPYSPQNATRTIASQLYARGGDWQLAQDQAELAWMSRTYLPAAALLARIHAHERNFVSANRVITEMRERTRPLDTVSQDQIASLERLVNSAH